MRARARRCARWVWCKRAPIIVTFDADSWLGAVVGEGSKLQTLQILYSFLKRSYDDGAWDVHGTRVTSHLPKGRLQWLGGS